MRDLRLLLVGLVVASCLQSVSGDSQHELQPRQNPAPLPTASPTLFSISPVPTSDGSEARTSPPDSPESTPSPSSSSEAGSSSSLTTTLGDSNSATTSAPSVEPTNPKQKSTSVANAPAATSTGVNKTLDMLPLTPTITPALGIAGAIMLISGVVYTIIGIKNKWIQISLSAAYLTSLAVTVLIVYVMNPPISNAIQGAYLVAAVVTGAVFGGLSLIFTEVTEGLGCLLGGFCLSMWFLVLSPGGLIKPTGGKVGFIAGLCVAVFAFALHRKTRPYALMGSTSFAGATIVVLGIDCFARAGLKEFWLYIWNLNADLFPVDTNTYPHTRGIRVEIAAIVLIACLGVVSQMKLWKVIKKRRDEKAAEREAEERNLDRLEENVGRKVVEDISRERVQWEGIYGNPDYAPTLKADSGIGEDLDSTRQGSMSVKEGRDKGKPGESTEMSDLGSSRRSSRANDASKRNSRESGKAGNTVTVGHDGEVIRERGSLPEKTGDAKTASARNSARLSGIRNSFGSIKGKDGTGIGAPRSSVTAAPAIVPLPFTIPQIDETTENEDRASIDAFDDFRFDSPRQSKRLSTVSALKRLSSVGSRHSRAISESGQSLIIPHVEDDRASSVAATVDELTNDQNSVALSDYEHALDGMGHEGTVTHRSSMAMPDFPSHRMSTESPTAAVFSKMNVDGAQAKRNGSLAVPEGHSSRRTSTVENGTPDAALKKLSDPASPTASTSPQTKEDTPSTPKVGEEARETASDAGSKSERPERKSLAGAALEPRKSVSKVVMSYRTNEWAKHLSNAEKPHLDELKLAAVAREESAEKSTEVAVPVDVESLQQTAEDARPVAVSRSMSQTSLRPEASAGLGLLGRSTTNSSRLSLTQPSPPPRAALPGVYGQVNLPQRSLSQTSLQSFSPAPSMLHSATPGAGRGYRSGSGPLHAQPLVESASEDVYSLPQQPSRFVPSPMPSSTLMGKRDSLLRNKHSTSSVNLFTASTPDLTPNDSASVHNSRLSTLEEDEMSLAERRAQLQQQQLQRRTSTPLLRQASLNFDSHQPKRDAAEVDRQRRESMLAHWRQSVQDDLTTGPDPDLIAADGQRAKLLLEKQQRRASEQQAALGHKIRDSAFDERMRRGDMVDLHREAMRRMQAGANKHV